MDYHNNKSAKRPPLKVIVPRILIRPVETSKIDTIIGVKMIEGDIKDALVLEKGTISARTGNFFCKYNSFFIPADFFIEDDALIEALTIIIKKYRELKSNPGKEDEPNANANSGGNAPGDGKE